MISIGLTNQGVFWSTESRMLLNTLNEMCFSMISFFSVFPPTSIAEATEKNESAENRFLTAIAAWIDSDAWFVPLPNGSYQPPNDSYRPPNDSYHRQTTPTIAERLLPSAERFLPSKNGSYHGKMTPTDCRTVFKSEQIKFWRWNRILRHKGNAFPMKNTKGMKFFYWWPHALRGGAI